MAWAELSDLQVGRLTDGYVKVQLALVGFWSQQNIIDFKVAVMGTLVSM